MLLQIDLYVNDEMKGFSWQQVVQGYWTLDRRVGTEEGDINLKLHCNHFGSYEIKRSIWRVLMWYDVVCFLETSVLKT